jgi:putative CocE/NonD family hydrolase
MIQCRAEKRPDVLLFSTDELTEPGAVTGRITATLFVTSDCPDTDFSVKPRDVYLDGRSMLVTDGTLWSRYQKSFLKESLLEPGPVYELRVDLEITSLVFNKGHRVGVAAIATASA